MQGNHEDDGDGAHPSVWKPRVHPGLQIQGVGAEAVVLDRAQERVHQLNEVGAFVLGLCDGSRTVGEIADAVVDAFEVTRTVADRDITDLVGRLRALEIVI